VNVMQDTCPGCGAPIAPLTLDEPFQCACGAYFHGGDWWQTKDAYDRHNPPMEAQT